MSQINLNQILSFAAQKEVSDIHFQVGIPPMVRRMGQLYLLKYPVLTEADTLYISDKYWPSILMKINLKKKSKTMTDRSLSLKWPASG
jgi:Tfp pilus assembly pilus retraction ATPase PilT